MSVDLTAAANRALAEGASFRAVRRARLKLPEREAEFATRNALEDALRTADFGDAGRLIVVRSLTLKGLPRGATGPQIARALERAWQALAPSALPFDACAAQSADVVYFRSILAARLAWLQRFAQDEDLTAWFWPRALPELREQSPQAALVPLLLSLQLAAPQALAQTIAALPPTVIRRVMNALPAASVDALLEIALARGAARVADAKPNAAPLEASRAKDHAFGASRSMSSPMPAGSISAPAQALSLPQRIWLRERLAIVAPDFAASDWRLTWIVALLVRVDNDQRPAESVVADLIDAVVRPPTELARTPEATASDFASYSPPPAAGARPLTTPRTERPAASASAHIESGLRPAARGARYPWLDDSQSTAFGGLLMLLNALKVLRFPTWLAAQQAPVRAFFARALLARIAQRLHVPAADPHWTLLSFDGVAQRALQDTPCLWQDFRWPCGFDANGLAPRTATTDVENAQWRWQRAMGRLLRRHASVGLVHLVWRAAGVSITPMHVDIVLPLAQADPILRRVGLDSDPGWIAWFGWIVTFYYLDGAPDGAR